MAKKVLEIVFGFLAISVAVYGLIVTRNLILGLITLGFVVILPVVAYIATHLPPQVNKRLTVRFRCSGCGTYFEVSAPRLLLSRRFSGYSSPHGLPLPRPDPTTIPKAAYYLRCPKCSKKFWLTPESKHLLDNQNR